MQRVRASSRLLYLSRHIRQLPCTSRQLCNEGNELTRSRLSDVSTAGIGMRRIGKHIIQSVMCVTFPFAYERKSFLCRKQAPPSEVQAQHLNIDALAAALATQCADGYDFETFANKCVCQSFCCERYIVVSLTATVFTTTSTCTFASMFYVYGIVCYVQQNYLTLSSSSA